MYSFALGASSAAISLQLFSFASTTQKTAKVATYAPSIASGTTLIDFTTTTNTTITTATFAVSPAKNATSARRGSMTGRLPNATTAIARLATLLIPPPRRAETAARESAIAQLTSAHSRVTAAWPSTTLRARRRGLGRSLAITAFPFLGPAPGANVAGGPGKKPADYRERTRRSPHNMTSRLSHPHSRAPAGPGGAAGRRGAGAEM